MRSKALLFVLLSVSRVSLAAEYIDNQTVIPENLKSFFSAKPLVEDPMTTNLNHQILIGIIDSGVDYNNPYLRSKIHYSFDKKGQITGAGIDFIKKDFWPLPYLARTHFSYDKSASTLKEKKESDLYTKQILDISPTLSHFINANRNLTAENENLIYHGTHVAGLASYDDSRIGIIPYRIMPFANSIDPKNDENRPYTSEFLYYVEKAIVDAEARGVKIINFSLEISFDKTEQSVEVLKLSFKKFENLVKSHPQIVFVAASGNEHTWYDGASRFNFPCGINAQNLICVSALDKDGNLAEFTNIPFTSSPIVFTPGEAIISTMPTYYCNSESIKEVQSFGNESKIGTSFKNDKEKNTIILREAKRISKQLSEECSSEKSLLTSLSGTSMSSPLIARLIAQKILNLPNGSNLNGADIITEFLKDAKRDVRGPLNMLKIKAPKPSWYKTEDSDFATWSHNSGDYFEFFLKK